MNELGAFSLNEISALAELPQRTVRYYIPCGLIDHPRDIGPDGATALVQPNDGTPLSELSRCAPVKTSLGVWRACPSFSIESMRQYAD
ncbi:MAG: hypothetical protein K2W80_01885 [Burkholderiales bacterium]|nr:hypothetical protein [Burkholderiales bacterium]